MDWLTPQAGLLAAAVAVPLLVLLYFLRLRRPSVPVSSTLLWRRAVADLQVNAPFRRLRRNLLLLLQLLALGCVLAGLAGPVLRLDTGPAARYVLLIDRSASMNATDGAGGSPTRLDQAKREARTVIESLRSAGRFRLLGPSGGGQDGGDQAMVIAFDEHAKVVCSFTSDRQKLLAAIDAIEPSDGRTAMAEALTLARAFAQSPGVEANNRSSVTPARIELYSDGRIGDLDQLAIAPGEVRFHAVGQSGDNVGLVAMSARRSYERPEQAEVFAALANYGPAEANCQVELNVDGAAQAVRAVKVPPRRPATALEPARPGQVSVTFTLTHPGAGLVEVRQRRDGRPDVLACDDAAWAVLPPPRRLSVLLVTAGGAKPPRNDSGSPASVLVGALRACPVAELKIATPGEFDAMLQAASGGAAPPVQFDLVVLDNVAANLSAALPPGRYVVFGPPPKELGLAAQPSSELVNIIDWQGQHPVLQHVNLENLVVQKHWRLTGKGSGAGAAGDSPAGPGFQVLARFSDGPAIALARRQSGVFLLVPFDVMESNWPFDAGFVMFCYNVSGFIGSEMGQADQASGAGSLPVGGVIAVNAAGAAPAAGGVGAPATVAGPGGIKASVPPSASGLFRFVDTRRVGVYTVTAPNGAVSRFAVNLLDRQESNVEPDRRIVMGGQEVVAQPAGSEAGAAGNQEVWPWLVLAAVVLVCLEWMAYNSRVRL